VGRPVISLPKSKPTTSPDLGPRPTVAMLRNVVEGDLRTFFEHQRDPEAISMAASPTREWDAFVSHWRHKILGEPANEARTILVDDRVVGSWEQDGRRLVGYWVGKEYWGRGVARSGARRIPENLRTPSANPCVRCTIECALDSRPRKVWLPTRWRTNSGAGRGGRSFISIRWWLNVHACHCALS